MRRSLTIFLFVACLAVLLASPAAAQTQITIGGSTQGEVQFTAGTPGSATMSFVGSCSGTANCVSGYSYVGAEVGTYSMWITGANPVLTSTSNPDIFAVNMNGGTLNFSFNIGSSNITGTIELTMLKDGTLSPQVLGNLTVSSATGLFASLWNAGSIVPLDLTFTLPSGSALVDQVVSGIAGSTTGTVSSGEILAAPEPASIALIGSGLIALGGVLKRRGKR